MEILIVVAIIAILVTISIPTFTNQLEKSREAANLANVRSAYAEVLSKTLLGDQDLDKVECLVPLKQKVDGFQGVTNPNIGGITQDNQTQWRGTPQGGGNCLVYCDIENGIILDWYGGSYGRPTSPFKNIETQVGSRTTNPGDILNGGNTTRLSSAQLARLRSGKKYQATFKLPADLTEKETELLKGCTISVGTLLFPDSKGMGKVDDANDSKWQHFRNGEQSLTISGITATDTNKYLGINLKITSPNRNDLDFSNNQNAEVGKILKRIMQNAEITEVRDNK